MLSFPCNSAELCPEQHFLTPNFLSFMLLLSRFTKSFKNKLLKAFTKKGRLASVKNCHPLKFCGIVFIPFLQKKNSISISWSLYWIFTARCIKIKLLQNMTPATVTLLCWNRWREQLDASYIVVSNAVFYYPIQFNSLFATHLLQQFEIY